MEKITVDGTNAIFGRLASMVAKELLKGNEVRVINCENILVSGDKRKFAQKILKKRDMGRGGSMKGPKYIRQEDRLVKRMIRGMLPRDTARGQEAFKRLRCYIGGTVPENAVKLEHQKPIKYSTIGEIVSILK